MRFFAIVVAGAIALSGVFTTPAGAREGALNAQALRSCTEIADGSERLQCFDKAMAALNGAGESWRIAQNSDPLTEKAVVTLSVQGVSNGRDPIYLFVRCTEGRPEVYVVFNEYLGSDRDRGMEDMKKLSFRIGDEPLFSDFYWPLSTDSRAVFYNGNAGGDTGWFIGKLAKAGRLVVRTAPYRKSPVTATFDTTGLSAALDRVGEKCRWERL